jgi:hypothetical protein
MASIVKNRPAEELVKTNVSQERQNDLVNINLSDTESRDPGEPRTTALAITLSVVASIGGVIFGFDIGQISGPS